MRSSVRNILRMGHLWLRWAAFPGTTDGSCATCANSVQVHTAAGEGKAIAVARLKVVSSFED